MKRLLLILLLLPFSVMAASGDWKSPASATNGATWTNPDSVLASDDERALDDQLSQDDIEAEDFSIGAAAGSTIDSIIIRVEGYGEGPSARRKIDCALTKNGSSEVGDVVIIQFALAPDAYFEARGSTNDLWGTTWTAAEINATTFGVFVNPQASYVNAIYVDHIQVQVWWTEVSGEAGQVIIINQ